MAVKNKSEAYKRGFAQATGIGKQSRNDTRSPSYRRGFESVFIRLDRIASNEQHKQTAPNKHGKRRTCGQGIPCGASCISGKYTCRKTPKPEQVGAIKSFVGGSSEQTQKVTPASVPAISEADRQLSDRIAQAQANLDRATQIADLAGKLYGNKYLKLSPTENAVLRVAGIDSKSVNFKTHQTAQLALVAAKEELAKLSPSGKSAASTESKGRAKGEPLSVQIATKALDSKEHAIASRKLGFDTRDPSAAAMQAKQISHDLKKQKIPVSPLDVAAIRNYTGAGYVATNGALRGQQNDPNSNRATNQAIVARATNQALLKLPKFEGELRRDTRLPSELLN